MPGKFLVTGTGRSGTVFLTQALRDAGVRTGHESVYTRHGYRPRNWTRWEGDSSWMALPVIAIGVPRPEYMVHVVRDPRKVIASRYEVGLSRPVDEPVMRMWRDDLRYKVSNTEDPEVMFDWACRLWCGLVDVAEEFSDITLRIEDLSRDLATAELLLRAIGREGTDPTPFVTTPKNVNHSQSWHDRGILKAPPGGFAWDDLPTEVQERATMLGYTP